jgi:hypothetical protein
MPKVAPEHHYVLRYAERHPITIGNEDWMLVKLWATRNKRTLTAELHTMITEAAAAREYGSPKMIKSVIEVKQQRDFFFALVKRYEARYGLLDNDVMPPSPQS